MASLVLGTAGAIIGNIILPGLGGPIGWALGSAAGNVFFGQKPQQRLHDLHLQGSSYGQLIKIVYGKVRIAGNVIWQTDLQEHTGGGKGSGKGSQGSQPSYTASYDIALCETKVLQVLRAWAAGRLNYDFNQPGGPKIPFVLYDGNASQLPDPTEEAVEGVGNVPAYRGISRVVFADNDLTQYGNTLPQWSFEVVTAAGAIPWRVSTFNPRPGGGTGTFNATIDENQIITTGEYHNTISGAVYSEAKWNIDGSVVEAATSESCDPFGGCPFLTLNNDVRNLQVAFIWGNPGGGGIGNWYIGKSPFGAIVPANPAGGSIDSTIQDAVYQNDTIYSASPGPGGSAVIVRWTAPGGKPTGFVDGVHGLTGATAAGNLKLGTSDDDHLYVHDTAASAGTDLALWKLNHDCTIAHTWQKSELPAEWDSDYPQSFCVYKNLIVRNEGGEHLTHVWRIEANYSFTAIGTISQDPTSSFRSLIRLSNGLVMSADGIISLDPPPGIVTLAQVVADLCDRAGLSGQYDVSQLEPILVDGYVIESQMTCRAAIETLMPVYFFDAVESDGITKFVLRGGDSVVTFLDEDLAAHMDHDGLPSVLTCVHTPDVDLPSTLSFAYMNKDGDYQINTQTSQRMIGGSRDVRTISVPIVLTDSHAKKIVDSWLYNAWSERDAYTWYSSRKYAAYEPTDVCTVQGKVLRITKKLEGATGVIKWEGVLSRGANFVQAGAGGPANDPGQTLPTAQASQLVLLDIPLVNDADVPGFYVAMAGAVKPSWPGAVLNQSTDGGVTWHAVGLSTKPSVIGTASTVLPDFAGGNVFDEGSTVTVVIGLGGGTLLSVTAAAALAGEGAYLIGNEIVYAKNAVLTAPSTWVLSGMLRGRRGTEWATTSHIVGERFIKLPVTNIPMPTAEFYQTLSYRAVTFGRTLASAQTQTFANTGNALKCYSPTDVGGGSDASGNVTINWKRRTRVGGAWIDYNDVPLSEATESYIVQITDASYQIYARVITGLASPTCAYAAATQTTDFGRRQATVFGTVGQVGAFALGSQTRFAIPAGGAGNDLPITPVPPYVNPPTQPPPGPGAPVDLILAWPADSKIIPTVIGDRKVCQFTTGASVPMGKHIAVSEYGTNSPPTVRRCFIATDTGGVNVIPNSLSYGNTATSIIGTGFQQATLAALTTYYYIFDFVQQDGSLSGPPGLPAQTILNLN